MLDESLSNKGHFCSRRPPQRLIVAVTCSLVSRRSSAFRVNNPVPSDDEINIFCSRNVQKRQRLTYNRNIANLRGAAVHAVLASMVTKPGKAVGVVIANQNGLIS